MEVGDGASSNFVVESNYSADNNQGVIDGYPFDYEPELCFTDNDQKTEFGNNIDGYGSNDKSNMGGPVPYLVSDHMSPLLYKFL